MSQRDPTDSEESAGQFFFEKSDASAVYSEAEVVEPTLAAETEIEGEAAALFPIPIVPGPITLAKRPVSGRYNGTLGTFQLELRVDIDRTRPMNRLSGDFFQVSGGTTSYVGSFIVNTPTITVTTTQVVARGLGVYTFSAGAPVVEVTIPRRTVLQAQAPATVRFFTTGGAAGATYTCAFVSMYFRTVRLEIDRTSNITTPVFNSYNTGALPSGGAARSLSVVAAYGEAGIEMMPTGASDVVNVSEAGANTSWSDAELHASMQRHFSLWRDLPQWAVWLLVAQNHDLGGGLYGIMFDQQGKQRQGCAVFHYGIGGTTADKQRLQLYTYVHELGHCFNLLHSWQKSYATPPVPNRPSALSWMNYPWNYPGGGAATFWARFAFQFDNEEIIHLRHAFRNNIVMGGSDFAVGAGLGREVLADPVRDESGLMFNISTHKKSFALGEPVVLELALSSTQPKGRRVHTWLHPNCGMVKVVIQKPSGAVVAYDPLIDHLVGDRDGMVSIGDVIHDSAYIGFGKGGLYFDQPGNYLVRAVYAALDGSQAMSDIIRVRVRYPVTAAEEELADLFMGEDQGTLLALLGSDSEALDSGNAAFDEVLAKYPKHAMANYVRLMRGFNAGRAFKTVIEENENRLMVRAPKLEESEKLLAAAAESGVLDPVTTRQTLTALASVQINAGNEKAAALTANKLTAMAIRTV